MIPCNLMQQVCNTCGLPDELCVCEDVVKSEQEIEIYLEERSYGKKVTVIEGFNKNEVNADDLSSELKSSFACGGTVKNSQDKFSVELQGDYLPRIVEEMEERGYEVVEQ